jgi:drug/metabolite transporter (DMT)-like permease
VTSQGKLHHLTNRIPGQTYLWLAIPIFGASSAVTRKLTEIGAQSFVNGQNPISLCNVLFVGNLCALMVLIVLYGRQWQPRTLRQLSRKDWLNLVMVAILSSALAPGLIFQALALTKVNNVVLIGRLEPPLALALSVWLLRERVNSWEIIGAIAAFVGVVLTIFLQPPGAMMMQVGGISVGVGELLVAIAGLALAVSTIISKRLSQVPLGIYSIFRTALGTAVFFVAALVLYGNHHFMDVLSPFLWQWMLVYGAVIVVVGQSLWTVGLRNSTVSTASIVSSFTPIAGILAAYLVLGEVPTLAQYIGGSMILVGIVLSQVGIYKKTSRRVAKTSVDSMQAEQAIKAKVGFKGI